MGFFDWVAGLFGGSEASEERAPNAAPAQALPEAALIEGFQERLGGRTRWDASDLESALHDKALVRSLDLLAGEDPGAAIRFLRRLDEGAPEVPALRWKLAQLYLLRRDDEVALGILAGFVEDPERGAEAEALLAQVHERAGRMKEAARAYQRALVLRWGDPFLKENALRLRAHLGARALEPLEVVAHRPPEGYRILHPLGRGGFGTVYLGEEVALDRQVALKFLHAQKSASESRVSQFFEEAARIGSLGLSGVVGVYEIVRERHVLVLEYMTHGTLRDRLDKGRSLRPGAALGCVADLAQTLAQVHAQGLVHRDIKPANILFRGASEPVLGDFGIAGLENETALGETSLYSLSWGKGEVRREQDLHALGLVLVEALTGEAPPPREQRIGWLRSAVALFEGEVSEWVGATLQWMCADAQGRGPRDALELEVACRALLSAHGSPELGLAAARKALQELQVVKGGGYCEV